MTHVYIDRKPDGTPFYVGVGSNKRVRLAQRNVFHSRVAAKHPGWTRTVIETSSFEQCLEFEQLIVSEVGRRNNGTGPLVNLTDGGEGCLGMIQSDNCRQVQSMLRKGVPLSAGHREKIRLAGKGRRHSEEFKLKMKGNEFAKGNVLTPEHREAIRLAQKSNANTLGHKLSPEHIKKSTAHFLGNSYNKGKKWVTLLGESRLVDEDKANTLLEQGWVLGRSENMQVRPYMNNGKKESRVRAHLVDAYLMKDWKMGRLSW
jgi:hypothetical protein